MDDKVELAKVYIDLSKSDLKSSQILFENNQYPECIFHLQQSAEKIIKAIAVDTYSFTIEQIKNVSHTPLKLIRKIIDAQKEKNQEIVYSLRDENRTTESMFVKNYNPQSLLNSLNHSLSELDKIVTYIKTQKINENDAIELIMEMNNILNSEDETDNEVKETIMQSIESEVMWNIQSNDANYDYGEIFNKMKEDESFYIVKQKIDSILKIIPDFLKSFGISMIIGLLTSQAVESCRYPLKDKEKIISPLEEYDRSNFIIKNYIVISEFLRKGIELFENVKNQI